MTLSVTEESLHWLSAYWKECGAGLRWDTPFVLPPWLEAWWQVFAPEVKPTVLVVSQGDRVIGIAPLLIRDGVASIIGCPDVCDYVDFIVAPGREPDFFPALLSELKQRGVNLLDPGSLRPDSAAASGLPEAARKLGFEVSWHRDDVSLEVELPSTWDDYLQLLDAKQRHEVRRKLRRLEEAGSIGYRIVDTVEALPQFMDTFLRMFVGSREDKAAFMSEQMATFFRSMTRAMAEVGLLRSGMLELDGTPVAAVIAFDYQGIVYLYNSAYDPNYRSLSVGILSKALYIKDSIERGRRRFDFLKGGEHYKYHLGGKEVTLSTCRVVLG